MQSIIPMFAYIHACVQKFEFIRNINLYLLLYINILNGIRNALNLNEPKVLMHGCLAVDIVIQSIIFVFICGAYKNSPILFERRSFTILFFSAY